MGVQRLNPAQCGLNILSLPHRFSALLVACRSQRKHSVSTPPDLFCTKLVLVGLLVGAW